MSGPYEFAWPQKGKSLFVEGEEYHEFSHFGWGDVCTQLVTYLDGYKAAADSLIDRALDSKDISVLDTLVFPIFFLYRQFLELVMKFIFLAYSDAKKQEKISALNMAGHNLEMIWRQIKPLLLEGASEVETEDVGIVEDYVLQFQMFDRTSFAFRYPITKDLSLVLPHEERVDLPNLKARMDELANFFDGASGKLDAIKGIDAALAQEYASVLF
jgi:hypothetical protein